MKKIRLSILYAIFAGLLMFTFVHPIHAQTEVKEPVHMYLFYGQGCPHCAREKEFLKTVKEKLQDQIVIHEYEVYYDQEGMEAFNKTIELLDIQVGGVPFLVIGEKYFVGFGNAETTGVEIQTEIDACMTNTCNDTLAPILRGVEPAEPTDVPVSYSQGGTSPEKSSLFIDTHLFGDFDLKSVSLPIATIVIALVDGFNPCAMWILIFLITMLINLKDKKKLYILGSAFILTSGAMYFVFLAAWFNLFKFIGYVYWIKVIIGAVAIGSGVLHIKSALFSKGGCHVTNEKQRKSILQKAKKTITEKNYALALTGIITLAISVNLVEIVCSAGLPAIYTNLLSTIELSTFSYYSYILLYVLIFMLDDLLIFFIAIKTLEVTGISKKYSKWSSLIGGIIIFIIGIILIVKPDLLMFG